MSTDSDADEQGPPKLCGVCHAALGAEEEHIVGAGALLRLGNAAACRTAATVWSELLLLLPPLAAPPPPLQKWIA